MRKALDKLNLRPFFCLFATDPVAMMKVRPPEFLVIGAYAVVEVSDFVFIVIASHRFAVPLTEQPCCRRPSCLYYWRHGRKVTPYQLTESARACKLVHCMCKELDTLRQSLRY